ncbi:MAG: hypothetical protein IRZ15_14615 [Bryobacteraceae bacterium]|nr:hypothetical protein [Bryobacteraceae bacterium]
MKSIFLLMIAAVPLIAADVTGKWSGTLTVSTPDGEKPGPAYLVLKQEGAAVTGTAGPNEEEQYAIQNGKAEDGKLTFEVGRDDRVMKFVLRYESDEIKGDVSREHEGKLQTGKLAVRRIE